MRLSMEEPTGLWVQGEEGLQRFFTFPEFVTALEKSALAPDDLVWSHIVTAGRWMRVGDMRLFQMLTTESREPTSEQEPHVWPPPVKTDW